MRYAQIATTDSAVVSRYLPSNYSVLLVSEDDNMLLIGGEDNAGWSLDDYVLPRLASGLIFGKEVFPQA